MTTFKYDSFNNLVSKSKGTTSTYYVDKEYEVSETLTVQGSDIIVKKEMKHNIYAQNELVVTHTKTTIDNIKEVDITAYIHKDSLGSVDTVTNAKGEVILRNRYTPFGGLLSSSSPTSSKITKETLKGYTGHEQYYDLELINMGGRMYDPTISRFLSIDPLISMPYNSQRYNRYSYVMNNPLKYTDPTGYDALAPGEKPSDGEDRARSYMDKYDKNGDGNITGNEMGYGKGRDGDYKEEKEKFIAGVEAKREAAKSGTITSYVNATKELLPNDIQKAAKIVGAPVNVGLNIYDIGTAKDKKKAGAKVAGSLSLAAVGAISGFSFFGPPGAVVGAYLGDVYGGSKGEEMYEGFDGNNQYEDDNIDGF